MRKRIATAMLALLLVLGTSTGAWAIGITSISQVNFDAMAGTVPLALPVSSPAMFAAPDGGWTADMYFKVFLKGGVYTYCYQLDNTSAPGKESLSRLTITNPFHAQVYKQPGGTPTYLSFGYITGTGQAPTGFINNATYDGYYGYTFEVNDIAQLAPGSTSAWMYTRFTNQPGPTQAGVHNGLTDNDIAIGPVPEPSSMLLLGLGLVGFAGRIRKRFKA